MPWPVATYLPRLVVSPFLFLNSNLLFHSDNIRKPTMSETAHRSPSSPPKLHHGEEDVDLYKPNYRSRRVLFLLFLLLILLAGVTALVLYLVYRPSHPRFSITSASIITLQPAPSAIASAMQFTLRIRNPNNRASVAYDRLAAYALYRGQPITPLVPFLPLFQERRSEVSVAPVLGSRAPVPVPADVAGGLATDLQAYGLVALRLVVLGRVQFKSGPFRSGWHSVRVRCDVLIGLNAGLVPPFGASECDVDA